VDHFLGRMFETPGSVFPSELLRPERQDLEMFASGVDAIVEAQRRVALQCFEDGSVEAACPPLKAILHIMAHGNYEGAGIDAPEIRALFLRESLLASDWYQERLSVKQERDMALWQRHAAALDAFRAGPANVAGCHIDLENRLDLVCRELARVSSPTYLEELRGTIGADPFHGQIAREA
jgi:phosphoenolpyruvate carboxykinase (diphosphate)